MFGYVAHRLICWAIFFSFFFRGVHSRLVILLDNILIRVAIEDGGRKAKVESGWLGKEVAWET